MIICCDFYEYLQTALINVISYECCLFFVKYFIIAIEYLNTRKKKYLSPQVLFDFCEYFFFRNLF